MKLKKTGDKEEEEDKALFLYRSDPTTKRSKQYKLKESN